MDLEQSEKFCADKSEKRERQRHKRNFRRRATRRGAALLQSRLICATLHCVDIGLLFCTIYRLGARAYSDDLSKAFLRALPQVPGNHFCTHARNTAAFIYLAGGSRSLLDTQTDRERTNPPFFQLREITIPWQFIKSLRGHILCVSRNRKSLSRIFMPSPVYYTQGSFLGMRLPANRSSARFVTRKEQIDSLAHRPCTLSVAATTETNLIKRAGFRPSWETFYLILGPRARSEI
jgi:hypothetical protein